MTTGERGMHGFVVLRRGHLGMDRPPVMAIPLNDRGAAAPDHRLGGMDEVVGCVVWRVYPGDSIELHHPQVVPATFPPQGAPSDARPNPFLVDDPQRDGTPDLPES